MASENKPQKSVSSPKSSSAKPKRKSRLALYMLIIAGLVLVVGGISIAPFVFTGSTKKVLVRIPKNATPEMVKDTLYKYFDHKYADRVLFMAEAHTHDFADRYGAYEIPKGTSPFAAMRKITRGAQTPIRLTLNHFRDLPTITDCISRKLDFTKEQMYAAATDSTMLASYGLTPEQALSLFVEDTYEVYWTMTPQDVIKKIGDNYNILWSPTNKSKAKAVRFTPAEIMIIASITDEETNKADEKGHIGQLYINRVRRGMRLQSDPTVRYAVGNFSIQRVTKEHLMKESPYNTYRVNGLPPGPIRTTSKKTVKAILNEPFTEDIYMCAREDFSGYHNFTPDYAVHQQNALRYQHALDQRGIH